MAAEVRRIELEGAQNFRDLGGYPTADGGRTRWGRVYRADGLHRLTEADLLRYDTLGIGTVFDLRRDDERQRDPDPVASRHVSLVSRAPNEEQGEIEPPQLTEEGERFLYDVYVGILANAAAELGEILGTIATSDAPVLFHCTAGKDRTGVTAALLLEIVGVDRGVILDDYELSALWWKPANEDSGFLESMRAWGISPEGAAGMIGAPRWAMADTLTLLDHEYGGVETYLQGPAGLASDDLTALRNRLVQPI